MKRISSSLICLLYVAAMSIPCAEAASVPVTFTQLTGVTGGSPAATAVFRADLSGIAFTSIQSITLQDNSGGVGGSPGQFSGFDLDAIILSRTSVGTAAGAAALVGLSGFDYTTAGTFFTPGTQRAPADPKLFGTGPAGNTINNAVATLGAFDGDSSTILPDGFVSLGDGGIVSFNLASAITISPGLFLFIGEVGNNGEAISGLVTVSDAPVSTPEPVTMLLLGLGLLGLRAVRRSR